MVTTQRVSQKKRSTTEQSTDTAAALQASVEQLLERVSELCLQHESCDMLSAFLTQLAMAKVAWTAYTDDRYYRTDALRAEGLLDEH